MCDNPTDNHDTCSYCQLSLAAHDGDNLAIRVLMSAGVDPGDERECNNSLAYAISRGHAETVRLLLENGADPNRHDSMMRSTPIRQTYRSQDGKLFKLLVQYGADLSSVDLFDAVRSGNGDFVLELIDIGCSTMEIDGNTGRTLLHEAAIYDHALIARAIIDSGVSPNAKDRWGNLAIDLARRNNQQTVVALLEARSAEEDNSR